jgi:hypothetical protein
MQVFQKFTNFKLSDRSESCFLAFRQSKNAARADFSRFFDCSGDFYRHPPQDAWFAETCPWG